MANKVGTLSTGTEKSQNHVQGRNNLEWSLRPLFIWMDIICIHPVQRNRTITHLVIRYGIWLLCVSAAVAQLVLFFQGFQEDFENKTDFWNKTIDYCNWAVHNIGIHSWIIVCALWNLKWSQLHNSLVSLDVDMERYQPSTDFFKLCKIGIAALLYILIAVFRSFFLLSKMYCV